MHEHWLYSGGETIGVGKTSIMVKGRVIRFNDYFTLDIDRKAFDIGLVKESRKRLRGMPSDVRVFMRYSSSALERIYTSGKRKGEKTAGVYGWHVIFITQGKISARTKSYLRRAFKDDIMRTRIDNRRKKWKGAIFNYESGVIFEWKEMKKSGEWGRIDFRKVKYESEISPEKR